MRRGRPTGSGQSHATKPSPSPMRVAATDPFAALDGKPSSGPVDEISSRFPSLDQFSILHHGGKFDFDASSSTKSSEKDLGQRVTEKLADDAFAISQSKPLPNPSASKASTPAVSRAQKIISSNPELQAAASAPSVVYQPTPTRQPVSSYVSQGTMTSPTPSVTLRFPQSTNDHHRSTSLPRNQNTANTRTHRPEDEKSLHPNTIAKIPSFSQLSHVRNISSSRPSLEGGRPSQEALDPVSRTKSSNARPRPTSAYLESNMDFLREKEKESSSRPSMSDQKRPSYSRDTAIIDPVSDEETTIQSNVDFLRTMEDNETSKKHKRSSSGANKKEKRSSLPSLSGTKNILAGKFGDAFKRFENNANAPPGPRTPSPLQELERRDLTPIAGSEATDGRSDDGNILDDVDTMNPEQRRDIERRRLSMEERRVADAAAEYRKRLADRPSGPAPRSIGGVSRAISIQNKVKSLLDETTQSSPTKKNS